LRGPILAHDGDHRGHARRRSGLRHLVGGKGEDRGVALRDGGSESRGQLLPARSAQSPSDDLAHLVAGDLLVGLGRAHWRGVRRGDQIAHLLHTVLNLPAQRTVGTRLARLAGLHIALQRDLIALGHAQVDLLGGQGGVQGTVENRKLTAPVTGFDTPSGSVFYRLTSVDVASWAEAGGDRNPIHLLPGRAAEAGLSAGSGEVVAHGLLLGAISLALVQSSPLRQIDLVFIGSADVPMSERSARESWVTLAVDPASGDIAQGPRPVLRRR